MITARTESAPAIVRRRAFAAAFAALALTLTGCAGQAVDPATTPAPATVTDVAQQPGHATAPSGQAPGTVRLPEGGTATLIRKEVTENGSLPIPEGLDEATWWGAEVGAAKGVTLLSGHVNWKGALGPFDELWRDHAGAEITVADTAGGHWTYRVTEAVTVPKDALPAQAGRLFDQAGPHRLVLVTCGGDYVGGTEGYQDNRIVTAEPVSGP